MKAILVAVEVSAVGSKPPPAVGERISKDRRRDLGAAALFSTRTTFLQGRAGGFGLRAETGRVGLRAGIDPGCRAAILMHRLNCSGGALRALATLRVCVPVYLHGETWLPSLLL